MERLQHARDEMEHFVHVAAHDLQEPLRTVVNFAELLESRGGHQLGGEGREFLGYIVSGVTRMQRMLKDLLAFSQVDRQEARAVSVDCEHALSTAQENLKASLAENAAIVSHDALPTIVADPTHVEILFQNLIGNAVRFRGTAPPRVHVSARLETGQWVFSVRDNGIGIEPKHFDMIFRMFQRLHSDRYPGSGIGLTICKRIVERRGGRMWLESQPGRGTTFYFTVPAHQERPGQLG